MLNPLMVVQCGVKLREGWCDMAGIIGLAVKEALKKGSKFVANYYRVLGAASSLMPLGYEKVKEKKRIEMEEKAAA
jgi:hypothetical protein